MRRSLALLLLFAAMACRVQADLVNVGAVIDVGSGSAVVVDGDYADDAGTFILNGSLDVSGDVVNDAEAGDIFSGTGTLRLIGGSQALYGPMSIPNLDKTATSSATLTFMQGTASRITVADKLTLVGYEDGTRLKLRSTTAGSPWEINPAGTRVVQYLDVKDSRNVNTLPIAIYGTNSVDSGDNVNWQFVEKFTLTVTSGTGSGAYVAGTVVEILADNPTSGLVFDKWTGDISYLVDPSSSKTRLTMPSSAVSVTAAYKSAGTTYALVVTSGGGSGDYAAGTIVTITADSPAQGKVFNSWVGYSVASTSSSSTTLVMPARSVTVEATYRGQDESVYTLTVSNGSGSGKYTTGTEVTVKAASAPPGQIFNGWTGDVSYLSKTTSSQSVLTMPAASVSIAATYKAAKTTYYLTVVNGVGSGKYTAGQEVEIVASAPATDMVFNAWTGAKVFNPTLSTTKLVMPPLDVYVEATYRGSLAPTYALAVDKGIGSGSYAENTLVEISAEAADYGYVFSAWTGDTSTIADIYAYETTLKMPASSVSVTATYIKMEVASIVKFTSSHSESKKGSTDTYSINATFKYTGFSPADFMTTSTIVGMNFGDWSFLGCVQNDSKAKVSSAGGSAKLTGDNGDVLTLRWDTKKLTASVKSKQPINSGENILDLTGQDGSVSATLGGATISFDDVMWTGSIPYSGKTKIDKKGYQSWSVKGQD